MDVVEDIDLQQLATMVQQRFGRRLDASYLRGKTLLRDAVEAHLGCSSVQAEALVETMELQGYLRFPHLDDATHPADRRAWIIDDHPL
jgi:hypothetical protein